MSIDVKRCRSPTSRDGRLAKQWKWLIIESFGKGSHAREAKEIDMEESPIIIIAIIAAIVGAISAVVVVLGTLGLLGNLGFLG